MAWFDPRTWSRKDSQAGQAISVSRLGKPVWTDRNYENFAREGYGQNVIAFRCIRMIAEAASYCPILAYEGKKELAEHDLLKVLTKANPWASGVDVIDAVAANMMISGNGYIEGVFLDGQLREIYSLRPDRMKLVAGRRGYPSAWIYEVEGQRATYQMEGPKQPPICHLRTFNPLNDWYGMAPMEAAAYSIDVHNEASAFNKALLQNGASPTGALVFKGVGTDKDGTLTADQYTRLKSEMKDKFQGSRNAGRPLLLEGGLEWQAMGQSPKDMEFVDGKSVAAREIALAFGVPPMLLGIPGDNTYSNYTEANRAFYRTVVLPLLNRILAGIANWAAPTYPAIRLEPDTDRIDALASERQAVWDRIEKADFITTGEKREATGYGPYKPKAKDAGSHILVPGSMMPLEEAISPADGDEEIPPVGE